MNNSSGLPGMLRAWPDTAGLHLLVLLLAVLFSAGAFLLQGHFGLGLSDEGYFWYGVQRVLAGEIPLRDFGAYDPGRYYFAAALLGLAGDDGLLALRAVSAFVQAIGIYAALMMVMEAARRSGRAVLVALLLCSAAILALWMFEHYKQYDRTMAILLLLMLARLLQEPNRNRYFAFGFTVGLAAVIGRNHGLYGAIGGLLALLYLAFDRRDGKPGFHFSAGPLYWGAGVVVGFLPILLLSLFAPGFFDAFLASNRMLLEMGGTNLAIPVPWPWILPTATASLEDVVKTVVQGGLFISLLIFAIAGLAYLGYCRVKGRPQAPGFAAAVFMAPGYAHYAFSRADVYHLAIGILPLLVVALILLASTDRKWMAGVGLVVLLATSFLVTFRFHPIERECGRQTNRYGCTRLIVGHDELTVRLLTASLVGDLRKMAAATPPDREVLILPWLTGAYAVLGKRSPVWDTYAAFPRSETFQRAEIERIRQAKPGMIYLANSALDGNPALTYSNTNPLIFRHIIENYVLVTRLGNSYLFRPPELVGQAVR